MASEPFHLAIVGGGISGLTLYAALHYRQKELPNLKVTVYEQARHFGEIGAGVAFGPNSIRAMKVCSPQVYEGYKTVATTNLSPEKSQTWFDVLDGFTAKDEVGEQKALFDLTNPVGANSVHRAHFLNELIKLVPDGNAHFRKRLETIKDLPNGKVQMTFADGTVDEADAIIGTDGVKSRVRACIFGDDHPSTHPVYTHKYAYRGLIPMEIARKELGPDLASNAKLLLGKDGHVLTFPISHGRTMNVVAFKNNAADWPSDTKLTLPSTKEQVKADFHDFGPTVKKILDLLEPELDCWAIFDTGDHPCPTFVKGKVCLLGDAAHATSPHHGAGAGMCIEDAATMAELFADLHERGVSLKDGIEKLFVVYDHNRRERGQYLVQSSRRMGEIYEWRTELGDDVEKIKEETRRRCNSIWNPDVNDSIKVAKEELGKLLEEKA